MRTSFVATTSTAPTSDDLHGATIGRRDHTTKRTSTEGDRVGSHRRGAATIIVTTKLRDQSAFGASRRLSKTAANVNKRHQRRRFTNKFSGASR